MLTEETKRRIATLFLGISTTMKNAKKVIDDIKKEGSFNIKGIYDTINKDNKRTIDFLDIERYLKLNCVYTTLNEIKLMLYCCGIETIDYYDFFNCFMGIDEKEEKELMKSNQRTLFISDQIKFEKYINEMLNLVRTIMFYSDKIRKRDDFNVNDFMILIGKNEDSFTTLDLNIFLQCNSVYLTEEEFQDIFNIIGKESKGKITNHDIENLLFFNPTKHYFPKSPKSSHLSLDDVISSEQKVNNSINLNYTFHSNNSINLLLDYDPKYEYQLLNYLSFIMDKESQIEQCRNQLVFQSDYCINELFRFFDTDSKNYINLTDLEEGYRLFSIEANSQKLPLILRRYSNNVKNDITYKDFVNMLTPYNNKHYRDIILQRNKPSNNNYYILYKNFTHTMKILFKNLLSVLLESEILIEKEKEKLPKFIVDYIVRFIFPKVAHLYQDKVSKIELREYLSNSNIVFIDNDYDLLFNRLDKANKGFIDINDIIYELNLS